MLIMDATHLKAHRSASSLRGKKGGSERFIGRTKGGLNSKLHAVTDAKGRPIAMFLSASQTSDYIGAAALVRSLPRPRSCWLIAAMMPTGSATH
jgi:Transposase DDE domain